MHDVKQNTLEIYEIIFLLIREALFGGEYSFPESIDWGEVVKELRIQAIDVVAADILIQKANIPEELKVICERNVFQQIQRWYMLLEEQQKLVDLFKAASIPFAIVKGYAADMYYPKPEYRAMGDIDVIVCPKDCNSACRLMVSKGYEIVDTQNERHVELKKNGVEFELHWRFSSPLSSVKVQSLDRMVYEGIQHAQACSIGEYCFPSLPKLQNGLVLLQHINQHLEGGLGLRQIIDWMLYANFELTDEYWESTFQKAASDAGVEKLAITVTRMCQIYLGLSKKLLWCRKADEALCEELMEFIIYEGNFGRKHQNHDSNTTIWIMNRMRNPVLFMRFLQQRGILHWKAAHKYSFLIPFAWLYQIVRYVKLGFQRPNSLQALWADVRLSRRQCTFLDKLEAEQRSRGK